MPTTEPWHFGQTRDPFSMRPPVDHWHDSHQNWTDWVGGSGIVIYLTIREVVCALDRIRTRVNGFGDRRLNH